METVAVRVVRRFSEACSAGEIDAAAALFHPAGMVVGGVLAGPGRTFSGGPEAVRSVFERARERWEDFRMNERSIEPGGSPDRVLVRSALSARPHGAPVVSEWVSWGVFTVREGMIHSFRVFYTEDEGRVAAGLSPASDARSSASGHAEGSPTHAF